jgi:solute carrier family 13 (sodium-dependent dicarboxylate transporter), member 2/3/5
VLSWLLRWDALQQHPRYRAAGVALGLLVALPFAVTAPPDALPVAAWRTAGITLAMALWWIGGVLPAPVTALVPLVAFPLLGVSAVGETAAPYAHPIIFLMIGGFLLGHGIERVGLHERLVAVLLAPEILRRNPRRVLLALMIAAASLSALVSNTATTVMMLPIALLLARRCGAEGRQASVFALGLAHAASVGGVATLIGTFPNLVFANTASEQLGRTVGFASWAAVGVPFVVLAVPLAWWIDARMLPADGAPVAAPAAGSWRRGERPVLAVCALAAAAWLTLRPVDLGLFVVPGWSTALGLDVDDAWVAMAAGLSLFLLPGEGGQPLLRFREVERSMPWGVMFLLGGGFALARQIDGSGLSAALAGPVSQIALLPGPLPILAVCVVVTMLSELTSNTATIQLMLPLLVEGAARAGVDPMVWMVPATLAASCGFMMPISTPPMAIVAEGAQVRPADMAAAGFGLDVVLVVVATVVGGTLGPLLF